MFTVTLHKQVFTIFSRRHVAFTIKNCVTALLLVRILSLYPNNLTQDILQGRYDSIFRHNIGLMSRSLWTKFYAKVHAV